MSSGVDSGHGLGDTLRGCTDPTIFRRPRFGVEMTSLLTRRTVQAALAILVGTTSSALAQQPAPGSAATAPDTGQMAPDFTLPGATRYGLLKEPIKLSNFRGQTVVLAFFPRARTKG